MFIISSFSHKLGRRARILADVMSILCTVHRIWSEGGKLRVAVTISSSSGVIGGQRSGGREEVWGEWGVDGGVGDGGVVESSGGVVGCELRGDPESMGGGQAGKD